MSGRNRTEIISTLVVAIPKSYRWPMGDEGKQAMKQGGVAGPPPYPDCPQCDLDNSSEKMIPANGVIAFRSPESQVEITYIKKNSIGLKSKHLLFKQTK